MSRYQNRRPGEVSRIMAAAPLNGRLARGQKVLEQMAYEPRPAPVLLRVIKKLLDNDIEDI